MGGVMCRVSIVVEDVFSFSSTADSGGRAGKLDGNAVVLGCYPDESGWVALVFLIIFNFDLRRSCDG